MTWQILALIAVSISILIAALLLMFSRFFDFKMLEQSAKAELVFAASSVFVVVFLIVLVEYGTVVGKNIAAEMYLYTYKQAGLTYYDDITGTSQELTYTTFLDPRYTLIEISIIYMRATMYHTESIGQWVYRMSVVAHSGSSISQDVFMAFPMSGWSFGGIAQIMDNLLNTIYFLELIYRLQIYALRFIDIFTLPVLLPTGIVMRAFPPTRGAGAYVIAFSIGIYLVYPMAYLSAVFSSPNPNFGTLLPIPDPSLSESAKSGAIDELKMWYRAFGSVITGSLDKISNFSNTLLTNLCFFPFLALTITMTFIHFSNGLFGANVPEIGRGLMKLI